MIGLLERIEEIVVTPPVSNKFIFKKMNSIEGKRPASIKMQQSVPHGLFKAKKSRSLINLKKDMRITQDVPKPENIDFELYASMLNFEDEVDNF